MQSLTFKPKYQFRFSYTNNGNYLNETLQGDIIRVEGKELLLCSSSIRSGFYLYDFDRKGDYLTVFSNRGDAIDLLVTAIEIEAPTPEASQPENGALGIDYRQIIDLCNSAVSMRASYSIANNEDCQNLKRIKRTRAKFIEQIENKLRRLVREPQRHKNKSLNKEVYSFIQAHLDKIAILECNSVPEKEHLFYYIKIQDDAIRRMVDGLIPFIKGRSYLLPKSKKQKTNTRL